MARRILQIEEWGRVRLDLNASEKRALQAGAQRWQDKNGLTAPPFWFEGAQGEWLRARNYVGVLEAGEWLVEIWPKLDGESSSRHDVLRNFLWILEVANPPLKQFDEAFLQRASLEFFDVFALLFARHLLPELQEGLPLHYQNYRENLPLVRGRIQFSEQLSRHWDRRDKITCSWDELQVDSLLMRLLKCACSLLKARVQNFRAAELLNDCLGYFVEVAELSPREVLREEIIFNRHTERFQFCAAFARRLLENAAYEMTAGAVPGFSLLLDMNAVFEDYVRAALQTHFQTSVSSQHPVGALLNAPRTAIAQRADFRWRTAQHLWLGDAKYKVSTTARTSTPDADDVRQITVYGEIEARKNQETPHLALLYPFNASSDNDSEFRVKVSRAWSGSLLFWVPVKLCPPQRNLRAALPPHW